MEIEKSVFARKRWMKDAMLAYGFRQDGHHFLLEKDFLQGDFTLLLSVSDQGTVCGRVMDAITGEEYDQLRRETGGAYVNMVRSAYEALLGKIAKACCTDVLFASDQANRLAGLILQKFHICPDYPFDHMARYRSYGVFRHEKNRKWFALIMNVKKSLVDKGSCQDMVDILNLKIEPEKGSILHQIPGIYPAYHMNHRTWISVLLDGTVTDEKVISLIETSFALTK